MNILAIDSSTEILSLALSTEEGVQSMDFRAGSRHSELLMEWIDKLFISAGIKPQELGLTVCMEGPGSFTGLRIGYATAKGLSLALGIPLLPVPTLDCIASGFSIWPGLVLPVLDAKKNCFFASIYRGKNRLTDYMDADAETILSALGTHQNYDKEPIIVCGAGASLFMSRIDNMAHSKNIVIDPHFLSGKAPFLLNFIEENNKFEIEGNVYSGPLYIRKSDAELNLIK